MCIAFPQTQRINGWINEAGRWSLLGSRLLIGQGQIAGPHGRRKTDPAVFVCSAGALVGADVKGEIRVRRDVRAVPIFCGPLVGLGDYPFQLLPARNLNAVRRTIAAAAVDPTGFRGPPLSRTLGS